MALPADISGRAQCRPGSPLEDLRAEYVKLVTAVRAICTKLDADVGVTDTNYVATITANDAASPAKLTVI